MNEKTTRSTLSEKMEYAIQGDITDGSLAPGSRLKLEELAKSHGVSKTVLREALNRLTIRGFVTLRPQVGFTVVQLSVTDLADLTESRILIEGMALERSIGNGDIEWEQNVVGRHHALSHTPRDGESPSSISLAWTAAHDRFHSALIAACPNLRLIELATQLRDNAAVYRQWSASLGGLSIRDVDLEHRQIMDAAVARDADLAVKLQSAHIQRTTDLLIAAVSTPAAKGTHQG